MNETQKEILEKSFNLNFDEKIPENFRNLFGIPPEKTGILRGSGKT